MYRLKFLDRYVKDTELRASASYVDTRSFGGKAVRFGTDVLYEGKVHLRAGYVGHDRRADATASLGFGLESGSFVIRHRPYLRGDPGRQWAVAGLDLPQIPVLSRRL